MKSPPDVDRKLNKRKGMGRGRRRKLRATDVERAVRTIARVRSSTFSRCDAIEVEAFDTESTAQRQSKQLWFGQFSPTAQSFQSISQKNYVEVFLDESMGATSDMCDPSPVSKSKEEDSSSSKPLAYDFRKLPLNSNNDDLSKNSKNETELEEEKQFDLMHICIKVYGLNGLVCEDLGKKSLPMDRCQSLNLSNQKRRSIKNRCFKEKQNFANVVEPVEETGEGSGATVSDQDTNNKASPIVLAASVTRNAFSSESLIETYICSQPIDANCTDGKLSQFYGLWQKPAKSCLQQENLETPDLSFRVLRMMMKKSYIRRDTTAIVENYVHENIPIRINICRGTEMVQLGIATLIVTGEEEGEVLMTLPTRSIYSNGNPAERISSDQYRRRKKKKQPTFQNDNKQFTLEENASLLVGVQIHTQQDMQIHAQQDIDDNILLLREAHARKVALCKQKANTIMREGKIVESPSSSGLNEMKTAPLENCDNIKQEMSISPQAAFQASGWDSPNGRESPIIAKKNAIMKESEDDSNNEMIYRCRHPPLNEINHVKHKLAYAPSVLSAVTLPTQKSTEEGLSELEKIVIDRALAS